MTDQVNQGAGPDAAPAQMPAELDARWADVIAGYEDEFAYYCFSDEGVRRLVTDLHTATASWIERALSAGEGATGEGWRDE